MGLNYSQKRLVGTPIHGKSKHARRLRLYAVLTGVMGMLISLVRLIVTVVHK